MFEKTKWRLTLLNTVVVALILGLLSMTLYLFMRNEISSRIDKQLLRNVDEYMKNYQFELGKKMDPRSIAIFYLKDGRIVTAPRVELSKDFLTQINPEYVKGTFMTLTEGDYHYRIVTKKDTGSSIQYVQVIRNINSEYEQLDVLKWFLIIGSLLGCLLSLIIGSLLAKYALIPIQRSWNQQKRFVGDASHELRTPIAVIQSGAEQLLQEPEKSILDHSEVVNRMLKETRRMNRLISDLLLLAKKDSDQIIVKKEKVNVFEIIKDVSDYFEDVAMLKNILFNVVCKNEIYANVDREKIQQLLINLLDNAMKYTQKEGTVSLCVSTVGQKLIISVKDNGIGIEEKHHKKLFDRFYRVDEARTRGEQRGYGLGLSIVKWIVDSHNGGIELKSELGKGTEFIISLPIKGD